MEHSLNPMQVFYYQIMLNIYRGGQVYMQHVRWVILVLQKHYCSMGVHSSHVTHGVSQYFISLPGKGDFRW